MEASNLLVEAFFVASVLASQDGKDRFVRLLGQALRGRPILVPNRLFAGRLGDGMRDTTAKNDRQKRHEHFHGAYCNKKPVAPVRVFRLRLSVRAAPCER